MTDEIDILYNWIPEGVGYAKIDLTRDFYNDQNLTTLGSKYAHINQWVTRLYRNDKLSRHYTGTKFVYFKGELLNVN